MSSGAAVRAPLHIGVPLGEWSVTTGEWAPNQILTMTPYEQYRHNIWHRFPCAPVLDVWKLPPNGECAHLWRRIDPYDGGTDACMLCCEWRASE